MSLRNVALPTQHVAAEALAAPLFTDASLSAALTQLSPGMGGDTGEVWRETERHLTTQSPGVSLDELILLRDAAWFLPNDSSPVGLRTVLRRATEDVFVLSHGAPVAAHAPLPADSRGRWRWLSFALPPDLLLAAASAPQEPELLGSTLQTMLADAGLAEPHLHLKAAIEFPDLWASLLRRAADPAAAGDLLTGPGADFDEGRGFAGWILRAGIARLFIAGFLRHNAGDFGSYVQGHAAPTLNGYLTPGVAAWAFDAVGDLTRGTGTVSIGHLQHVYNRLVGGSFTAANADLIPELDPVAPLFPPTGSSCPDFQMTRAALDYLESRRDAGQPDGVFERVFWQVVRIRVRFYRHVVQRPLVPGLLWFTRTYSRLSRPRRCLAPGCFLDTARQMGGQGLRSLEVRIAPEATFDECLSVLQEIEGWRDTRCPSDLELGVVVHFSRDRGSASIQGRPRAHGGREHGDPRSGYRYAGYFTSQRKHAAAIARVLTTYPRSLALLRGVDLCTDELGVPLWVLRPLVEHIREAAEVAFAALARGERARLSRFRTTVHAGEDFVHLMGGIRRVGEAVVDLQLRDGDRVGHAVALGVDVRRWCASVGRVSITVDERLADLVWAYRTIRAWPDDLGPHLASTAAEIVELASRVFARQVGGVEQVVAALSHLGQTGDLHALGYPAGPQPAVGSAGGALGLALEWLTSGAVYRRGNEHVSVDVQRECDLVESLQKVVRRDVARRGVVIEVNPSSNLLVGHLGDLKHHPLWGLCPPGPAHPEAISIAIGSDDPITFATRLVDEYQLVLDALTQAGHPAHEAVAWLDRARAVGMSSRSTVPVRWRLSGLLSGLSPLSLPLG